METVPFSESVASTAKMQKDICLKVVTFSHAVYQSSISERQDDEKKLHIQNMRNYFIFHQTWK